MSFPALGKRPALFVLGLLSSLLVTACGGGNGSPQSVSAPPPPAPTLSLTLSPGTLTVYPGTTFSVTVTATETQLSATPSVTLGQLPTGLTTTTTFPLSIPENGAQISFVAAKTLPAGSYTISLSATAGSETATATLDATIAAGTPPTFFLTDPNVEPPFLSEAAVAPGGSASLQFTSGTTNQLPADYTVQLSVSGLPPGTVASISPQTITPGQNVTVSVSAASTAATTQNATVTLTATPSAPVPSASVSFLLDVTQASGSLPENRTDYVSTEGSPYAAVYDSVHNLIFSSNPSWNRVDVISNVSHQIVKSIPVRQPRGIDITQDSSQVWVATASQQMFSINTATMAATGYMLPSYIPYANSTNTPWQAEQIFALADGTVMVEIILGSTLTDYPSFVVDWNPGTNTLTGIASPTGSLFAAIWDDVMRTGDGKHVYSIGSDSAGESFSYDVATKTVSSATELGGYASAAAVNFDGSRVVVEDANGLNMYDGNFNLIGAVPGGYVGPGYSGGLIFSPDGQTLYEETMPLFTPLIYTIGTSPIQVQGIAPAMPMAPFGVILSQEFYIPQPFAVDNNGILLGLQDWGIAFDDATFVENLSPYEPGTPSPLDMSPYSGPLAGGTASSESGIVLKLTPNVWYGANRGTASLDSSGNLTITSPPATQSGPVNLKFLFPDGTEVFNPLFFSYGPVPQYAMLSGAAPQGGVPGEIAGYDMPTDPSGGTITVGGNNAAITSSQPQPVTGAPFPSTISSFTVPAGTPGWADISVNTPSGTGTLSKAFFYAQSVKDFSSTDSLTAVLYDEKRQQLYLSAQDHIDVFSLASNQFMTPLTPAAQGSQKQFAGLALTPDGSLLLAADLLDGSLALIDPDNPANGSVIPVAPATTGTNFNNAGCKIGPLYVAATINQQAYVVTGALPSGNTCGPGGTVYQVNLATQSVSFASGACGGGNVASSSDGATVVFGKDPAGYGSFCTYNVSQNTYNVTGDYRGSAAISGDANVVSAQWTFMDSAANVIGAVAQPIIYYATVQGPVSPAYYPVLQQPQLNDSGSLYYLTAPSSVDIVDVQHGALRMRFSLSETIANTASPVAIDSGGRHIYLITNMGLTIVDLGEAPLSIGHLTPSVASPGTQVTIRGSGFETGLVATVGGQPVPVSVVDENTLTLTMPTLGSGPHDIVLQNSEGPGYTLENGLTAP